MLKLVHDIYIYYHVFHGGVANGATKMHTETDWPPTSGHDATLAMLMLSAIANAQKMQRLLVNAGKIHNVPPLVKLSACGDLLLRFT